MPIKLKVFLVLASVIFFTSCNKGIVDQQLIDKWNFGTIELELTKGSGLGTEYYSDNYIFLQEESKATSFLFGHYLNGS